MADELPLADVTAFVSHQRSSVTGTQDAYAITVQIGAGPTSSKRADQKQVDNFLRGTNGKKLVRLMLLPLPEDWVAVVDPNQGAEELVSVEDQLIALWNEKIRLMSDASP